MSEQTEMRIKMKTLVLAEKPSVGRDIGRVLHCTPQGNGFLEGKDYICLLYTSRPWWNIRHMLMQILFIIHQTVTASTSVVKYSNGWKNRAVWKQWKSAMKMCIRDSPESGQRSRCSGNSCSGSLKRRIPYRRYYVRRTVSYTHLDVYKRQGSFNSSTLFLMFSA